MNAMIRALKGTLAVLALAGLGWLLRWMTAGSISGLRTYDLDSLTVLAVGTIAWIAYIWLALAVVLTVLEQVPGVVGALAGAVAGRITTKTARALLRSGLGVAAVTPLTVGVAHAAPTDSAHVRHVTSAEAASTLGIGGTQQGNYRATEAASSLEIGNTTEQANYRSTEQASHLEIGSTDQSDYRATEAASTLEIGNTTDRSTEQPPSSLEITDDPHSAVGPSGTTNTFRSIEPPSHLQIGPTDPTTPGQPTGNPTANHQTGTGRTTTPGTSPTGQHPGATTQGQHSRTGKPATPGKPSTQEQHTGSDSTTVNPPAAGHGNGSSQGTTGATGNQAGSGDSDRTSTGRTGDTRSSSIAGAGDSRRTSTGRPSGGEGPAGTGQQPGGRGQVGVPDRPTDGAPTRYTDLRPAVPVSVVVRAGDSLWSIAARELGPSATNEAIAARWHDWYSANRHVIGNDPDLILPGQVLRTPPAPHGDRLPPHQQEQ